jgi:hypothetical protein
MINEFPKMNCNLQWHPGKIIILQAREAQIKRS